MSDLGETIRAWRERSGYSQTELGKLVGVTQQTVSDWENGATKPRTAQLIAVTEKLIIPALEVGRALGAGEDEAPPISLEDRVANLEDRLGRVEGLLDQLLERRDR